MELEDLYSGLLRNADASVGAAGVSALAVVICSSTARKASMGVSVRWPSSPLRTSRSSSSTTDRERSHVRRRGSARGQGRSARAEPWARGQPKCRYTRDRRADRGISRRRLRAGAGLGCAHRRGLLGRCDGRRRAGGARGARRVRRSVPQAAEPLAAARGGARQEHGPDLPALALPTTPMEDPREERAARRLLASRSQHVVPAGRSPTRGGLRRAVPLRGRGARSLPAVGARPSWLPSLVVEPAAVVLHHFDATFSDVLRRSRAYGRGSARMYRKWPAVRPWIFPGLRPRPGGAAVLAASAVGRVLALLTPPLVFPRGCMHGGAARTSADAARSVHPGRPGMRRERGFCRGMVASVVTSLPRSTRSRDRSACAVDVPGARAPDRGHRRQRAAQAPGGGPLQRCCRARWSSLRSWVLPPCSSGARTGPLRPCSSPAC